jgi:hypothetical protein
MLTAENYFSLENEMKYMGSSQYKAFDKCEAMALAKIKGEWEEEKSTALLVGRYVDAHYEGTLDIFKAKNPARFTQKGEWKSEYKQAEYRIQRLERDELFAENMSGWKQVIQIGSILGVPFKIKMDSYFPGVKIVDGKIMKDFEPIWKDGLRLNFIEAWGYDIQGAIYQEIERQNSASGEQLPFIIAAGTKEKPEPDLEIFSIPQSRLDYCLEIVMDNVKRFDDIKKGIIEPTRCGHCDYCKSTKVLTEIIDYQSL